MQLRVLGKSGLMVSPLCFGGNVFGWTADEPTSFKLLDAMGWLRNLRHEPQRYRRWIAADSMYPDVPRTLTHLFEYLAVIAIAVLLCLPALASPLFIE